MSDRPDYIPNAMLVESSVSAPPELTGPVINTVQQGNASIEADAPPIVPYSKRFVSAMFMFLGVGHVIFSCFLLSTGVLLDRHVFPGRSWNFRTTQVKSSLLFVGFVTAIFCGHRLSFFNAIFNGFLIMSLSNLWFILVVIFLNDSTSGFVQAMIAGSINAYFSAITRSKELGVAFNISTDCSWYEMQGLGIAGVLSVVSNISIKLLNSRNTRATLIACYTMCGVWQFLCALTWVPLERMHAFVMWRSAVDESKGKRDSCSSIYLMRDRNSGESSFDIRTRLSSLPTEAEGMAVSEESTKYLDDDLKITRPRSLCTIVWDAKFELLNCMLVLCVTFIVFPGVTLSWKAQQNWDVEWFGIYLAALFLFSDVAARVLSRWPIPRRAVLHFLVCRIILIPICCLCRRYPEHQIWGGVVFQTTMMIILAMSNGYGFGVSTFYATIQARSPTENVMLGPCVAFAYLIGLLLGSGLSEFAKVASGG